MNDVKSKWVYKLYNSMISRDSVLRTIHSYHDNGTVFITSTGYISKSYV